MLSCRASESPRMRDPRPWPWLSQSVFGGSGPQTNRNHLTGSVLLLELDRFGQGMLVIRIYQEGDVVGDSVFFDNNHVRGRIRYVFDANI